MKPGIELGKKLLPGRGVRFLMGPRQVSALGREPPRSRPYVSSGPAGVPRKVGPSFICCCLITMRSL